MRTPDFEAVLNDFRTWFAETRDVPGDVLPGPGAIDLHTVLAQATALRQEVNLQTRAVRAQQEQNAELLRHLSHAVELLSQPKDDEDIRGLLKTLVELHDALSLAAREVDRARAALLTLFDDLTDTAEPEGVREEAPPPDVPPRSFWSRWILSPHADRTLRASQQETQRANERLRQEEAARRDRARRLHEGSEQVRGMIEALRTGYAMGLRRIERALEQHGLEPIPVLGERFDPERMEVLEAVPGTGRPAGDVVEEVRRGYLKQGKVFRFSLVRVARDG